MDEKNRMEDTKYFEELKKYDSPTITNVIATYPEKPEFCLVLYDLCHVMAEHMAHGVNRLYLFHDTSFFPVCFCVQYSVFSVKNP